MAAKRRIAVLKKQKQKQFDLSCADAYKNLTYICKITLKIVKFCDFELVILNITPNR